MANLSNALRLFDRKVTESEQIVSSVEALWQTAPMGSQVRRQIDESQLSALYEMAYLSLFGHWENFIQDCTVRMIAGQGCPSYSPTVVTPPAARTLSSARTRVLGGKKFLLWYDPVRSADRIASHVAGSPLESMLRTSATDIQNLSAVRHAIAHQSEDALLSFKTASFLIGGIEYATPGELLRSQDHSDPLNPTRWLRKFTNDLRLLALRSTS